MTNPLQPWMQEAAAKMHRFGCGCDPNSPDLLLQPDVHCEAEIEATTEILAAHAPQQWIPVSESQIAHMVNRFLMWRLPENFNPDGGISFKPYRNECTAYPAKNEPVGTNLLDFTQAEAMIRYLLDGLPLPAPPVPETPAAQPSLTDDELANDLAVYVLGKVRDHLGIRGAEIDMDNEKESMQHLIREMRDEFLAPSVPPGEEKP